MLKNSDNLYVKRFKWIICCHRGREVSVQLGGTKSNALLQQDRQKGELFTDLCIQSTLSGRYMQEHIYKSVFFCVRGRRIIDCFKNGSEMSNDVLGSDHNYG